MNTYRPAQPRNTDHGLHKGQWSIRKFCLYGRRKDFSVVGNIFIEISPSTHLLHNFTVHTHALENDCNDK